MNKVAYPEDCHRIVQIANQLGYKCTLKQAEEFWDSHSEDYCAGWLDLPDDSELGKLIEDYFGT